MIVDPEARFLLCADDYASDERINLAVLDLIDAGRLGAVSAMATGALWPESAEDLAVRRSSVSIGMHFDLTSRPFEGKRPAYPLRSLIAAAISRRLELTPIADEFARQLDAFERALGFPPDHIDGHHHVHALPGIRNAVLWGLKRRFPEGSAHKRPWIRDPSDHWRRIALRPGARFKSLAVALLSSGFREKAHSEGFITNDGFSGFSRFQGPSHYAGEFACFSRAAGTSHLVMCHPAVGGYGPPDEIGAARAAEYAFLAAAPDLPQHLLPIRRDSTGSLNYPY